MKNIYVPQSVLSAFPVLSHATFVKHFELMDTTFDVFVTQAGLLYTLVASDYPDSQDQDREFQKLSKHYMFENLVRPHFNDEVIVIREHDEMNGDCVIEDTPGNLPYPLYYYVARTKEMPHSE
jgi:hypothetical protein